MIPGNFIADFSHAAGTSEVPKTFVRWAALSTVSATLTDRVWWRKGAGRVRPNLYVFLIGPSGLGKGEAINLAMRLLKDVPLVNTEYGRITAAAVVDRLALKGPSSRSKLFLVTPELAMAVGRGTQSDDLIKLMTELYSGSEVPLKERTRTNGLHVIKGHNLNWIAGTTREWLRDCVTREAVEGGFFARVACVQARYQGRRIAEPFIPPDYEIAMQRMREHLVYISGLEGEISVEPHAAAILNEWYMSRPEPTEEILLPSWRREDDFVRKVAMALMASEPDADLVVMPKHVTEAQQMVSDLSSQLPVIIDYIGSGLDSDTMRRVRQVIAEAGTVRHDVLAAQLARVGVTSDKLRICVDTLVEAGLAKRDRKPGGHIYKWTQRGTLRLTNGNDDGRDSDGDERE